MKKTKKGKNSIPRLFGPTAMENGWLCFIKVRLRPSRDSIRFSCWVGTLPQRRECERRRRNKTTAPGLRALARVCAGLSQTDPLRRNTSVALSPNAGNLLLTRGALSGRSDFHLANQVAITLHE